MHEFTAADPDGNLFRVFYDFATPERAKDTAMQPPIGTRIAFVETESSAAPLVA